MFESRSNSARGIGCIKQEPNVERADPSPTQALLNLARTRPLRETPGLRANDLAFAVGPEVDDHGRDVVDGCVCALVHQDRSEGGKRQDGQASLEAAMNAGAGKRLDRVLPGHHAKPHD